MNEILELLRFLRTNAALPLWVMAIALVGAAIKVTPAILERHNQRMRDKAEERAGDWTRLREEIGRLDGRVKALEDECADLRAKVRECEAREGAWIQRAIKAEAALQGLGEVRQAAANAAAEVRIAAAEEKAQRDA